MSNNQVKLTPEERKQHKLELRNAKRLEKEKKLQEAEELQKKEDEKYNEMEYIIAVKYDKIIPYLYQENSIC